jgi:hypothetical protein
VRSRNLRSTRPWPGSQLEGELGHAVVIKLGANVAADEVKDRSGLAVMWLQAARAVKNRRVMTMVRAGEVSLRDDSNAVRNR